MSLRPPLLALVALVFMTAPAVADETDAFEGLSFALVLVEEWRLAEEAASVCDAVPSAGLSPADERLRVRVRRSIERQQAFGAGMKAYRSKENEKALVSLRRAYDLLDASEPSLDPGLAVEICYWLGRTLPRLDRQREASDAFREGCTTWAGESDFTEYVQADYYRSARAAAVRAPEDLVLRARYEEAAAYLEVAEATFPDHHPGWEFDLELDFAREELRERER